MALTLRFSSKTPLLFLASVCSLVSLLTSLLAPIFSFSRPRIRGEKRQSKGKRRQEETANREPPTALVGTAETKGKARTKEDWARHRREERRRPRASKEDRATEERERHSFACASGERSEKKALFRVTRFTACRMQITRRGPPVCG